MMTASAYPLDQPRGRRLRGLRKASVAPGAMLGAPYQASGYITGEAPGSCPVCQNLLEKYNRIFNSWAAQDERDKDFDPVDFEILAQVEEAHQKLLRHQQSCPTCRRPR
jgi:hypothetical protein